jgi:hypothetical protein
LVDGSFLVLLGANVTSLKIGKMRRMGDPWSGDDRKRPWRDPLVCVRCGKLMSDFEPMSPCGEFFHGVRPGVVCANDRKTFYLDRETQLPELPKEVSAFERKRVRRAGKRAMRRQRRARTYERRA